MSQHSRGFASFHPNGRRPTAYDSGRVVPRQTVPLVTVPAGMQQNSNSSTTTTSLHPHRRAWNPLQLMGGLVSPCTTPRIGNLFPATAGRLRQAPHENMIIHPVTAKLSTMPALSTTNRTMVSHHGSVGALLHRPAPIKILQHGAGNSSSNGNASVGSFGNQSYMSNTNASIAHSGLSQNSFYTSNGSNGLRQNSVSTAGTATFNVSGDRSQVAPQQHFTAVDQNKIQALIDKTLERSFQVQVKELNDRQRSFHQRLVCAEEEQETSLVELRKTIADGMDTLQTKVTAGESHLQKTIVDNVATMDTKTTEFASLAAEALQRHEKLVHTTEVKASHVDQVYSKVTSLVHKVESSALQMKQLVKSTASTITMAREDFQKMFLSFLKKSSSAVSLEQAPVATVKASLDTTAIEGITVINEAASKMQTTSSSVTRSFSNPKNVSRKNSKHKPAGVVTKISSKAKHQVVGARTPLAALKTMPTTRTSSSSQNSSLKLNSRGNSNSSNNNIIDLSSPDRTIVSCVTPSCHHERPEDDHRCNLFVLGTPKKKSKSIDHGKAKPGRSKQCGPRSAVALVDVLSNLLRLHFVGTRKTRTKLRSVSSPRREMKSRISYIHACRLVMHLHTMLYRGRTLEPSLCGN